VVGGQLDFFEKKFWLTCKAVQTRAINGLRKVKTVKFIDPLGEKEPRIPPCGTNEHELNRG
jgi:hypothetical protein